MPPISALIGIGRHNLAPQAISQSSLPSVTRLRTGTNRLVEPVKQPHPEVNQNLVCADIGLTHRNNRPGRNCETRHPANKPPLFSQSVLLHHLSPSVVRHPTIHPAATAGGWILG